MKEEYSVHIVKILERVTAIETNFINFDKKLDQIVCNCKYHSKGIEDNRNDITKIDAKIKIGGTLVMLLATILGGVIASLIKGAI